MVRRRIKNDTRRTSRGPKTNAHRPEEQHRSPKMRLSLALAHKVCGQLAVGPWRWGLPGRHWWNPANQSRLNWEKQLWEFLIGGSQDAYCGS